MKSRLTRRSFLETAALGTAAAAFGMGKSAFAAESCPVSAGCAFKTQLFKGFLVEEPDEERCRAHAEAGFQGLEATVWNLPEDKVKANRKLVNDFGLRVHSVMRGWAELNSEDEAVRKASVESIKKAIRTASLYGADAILLVPCKINASCEPKDGGVRMPYPGDFNIEFDPTTCKVTKVVDGDNAPYQQYIDLQNRSTELTFQALQEAIPTAAYEGVTIAIENVWNNLWVQPALAAAFIKMFDNNWIKAYLDLGNHAKYAKTCDWLRAFGKSSLCKLHIKDFKRDPSKKDVGGEGFVGLGTGSINWQKVRQTIEEVGYNGWVSYEEGAFSPAEYGRRLDQFFKGEKITEA